MIIERKTKAKLYFKWFDFWIGLYFDRDHSALYFGYLPMLGVKIWREDVSLCPSCQQQAQKSALDAGDGWLLFWECYNSDCQDHSYDVIEEIEWPYGEALMNASDLKKLGYTII